MGGSSLTQSARYRRCPPAHHEPGSCWSPRRAQPDTAKAGELAKIARRDGQKFNCATWLHKVQKLPREELKREVKQHLAGKESEPLEMLYLKVYKSLLAVIERVLDSTSLMLGGQNATGYCLEMICANFLAGTNMGACGNTDSLLLALSRIWLLLANSQRQEFLLRFRKAS